MNELGRCRRLKEEALAALRSGRDERAREALSEVADALVRLAGESTGPLRLRRFREARELREAAARLGGKSGRAARSAAEDTAGSGAETAPRFESSVRPAVRFRDIAGLEEVKEAFRLKLVYPFLHPEKAQKYRLRRGGGLLLYGPPGTGKTLLARALAGEIDAAFYAVKPSEIMSKWVGEAEKNVEELFDEARSAPVAVIFIDEIDALAPRRSENTSPVMARLVPQILAELEGFDRDGEGTLLFLGATNEPWLLDPAILRPGRFDEAIYVGLPDRAARAEMLRIHLAGRPLADDLDFEGIAARLERFSGADVRKLCERVAEGAFLESVRDGADRTIRTADLLDAAAGIAPSVSVEALARYAQYAEARAGTAGTAGTTSEPQQGEALRDH